MNTKIITTTSQIKEYIFPVDIGFKLKQKIKDWEDYIILTNKKKADISGNIDKVLYNK